RTGAGVTPLTGSLELAALGGLAAEIRTRTLPHERTVLGKAATPARQPHRVAALSPVHFVTEPVAEALPLDAVELKLRFSAPWKEDVWWLRIQDPVNPRRDLLNVPVRLVNPTPGRDATFHVVLDCWDIMLDPQARLWVQLLPMQGLTLVPGEESSQVALLPGERAKVLAAFAHTQSQLAYSYWQLGSEAGGTAGSDPNAPGFALLGTITHNRELKLTLEWVRRHVPDHRLVNNLWTITYGKRERAAVPPRLQPPHPPHAAAAPAAGQRARVGRLGPGTARTLPPHGPPLGGPAGPRRSDRRRLERRHRFSRRLPLFAAAGRRQDAAHVRPHFRRHGANRLSA